MRNNILNAISEQMKKDEKLIVLLGDLGVFQMRKAMDIMPERVLNFGIMEQSMVGFAAGVSKGGFYPILYSITPFLIDRSYEQIKIDLIYNDSPSLIISAGGSYDYATLGPTHHCPHDISSLLAIDYPLIIHPFTTNQAISLCLYSIKKRVSTYLRISSNELDLKSLDLDLISQEVQVSNKKDKQYIEIYKTKNNRNNSCIFLFGPDAIFLKGVSKTINEVKNVISVPIINKDSMNHIARVILEFEIVFLAIPYESSGVINSLLEYIGGKNMTTKKIIQIHTKKSFFDNSYTKEEIFENSTIKTTIL